MQLSSLALESPALELIRQGLACDLELLRWTPGFSSELVARTGLHREGQLEQAGIGLLFLWSSLAFLEARPLTREGILPDDYLAEDGWSSLDFLRHLRWQRQALGVELSTLRGRKVSTQMDLQQTDSSGRGLFVVRTLGRGDSAFAWFERFRG